MPGNDLNKIISSFHNLERSVFPFLTKSKTVKELVALTNLQEVEVMRALQWLQNKGIIQIKEELSEMIELDSNGKEYLKNGLPEMKLLKALKSSAQSLEAARKRAGITKEEFNIALGVLRKKAAVFITKERELVLKIMEQGRKMLDKESLEDRFLKRQFPVTISSLLPEEKYAFEALRKRKEILKAHLVKLKAFTLTPLGNELVHSGIEVTDMDDRITPAMMRDGSWSRKKFRRYDVKINVPKLFGGRKQQYRSFLDEVRQKFLSMGFTEMFGPVVESEFWDMDALFMPQFHSARDIHQAYRVKEPATERIDLKLIDSIRRSHENGFGTGSTGWRYKFDIKKTQRTILRTHDTAISARTLALKDLKIPGKYFQTVRCFRPDVIDASHNVDFFQTGGFVIEDGIDFRHLKGLLKMFAEEFCQTDQVKIRPAYFPFTEPSAELFAKHPDLGWIELAGAGMFRPEMVMPLVGKNVPVIAWGVGIDRVAMFKLGISDIRKLFSHDLKMLRSVKVL